MIRSDRIWATDTEGDLVPRYGNVRLAEDEIVTNDDWDAPSVLQVTGRKEQDFAVFMHMPAQRDEPVGYLVSKVDETGEGVIVSGDALERDPQTWLNDRITGEIMLLGEQQLEEFGLASLCQFIQQNKLKRAG